jgi:adenine deaminase
LSPDDATAQAALRRRLVRVALGQEPADLVLRGGRLLNVYTGEIEDGTDVAVAGERIALVGDARPCVGAATRLIDVDGAHLVPGFVDAHYHIESSRLSPWRHAEATLPGGTTAIIADPHEACAVGGLDAIRYILETTTGLPQKVYVQVPSATPPSHVETTAGYIGAGEARRAMAWPRVIGLGELMDPQRLIRGDPRLWGLIEVALERGDLIEGHSGFSGSRLAAYAAAGVQDTHSPRTPEQALEMLRRGFDIQLKVERESETIRRLLRHAVDWGRIGLAVDDRPVERLLGDGGLDHEIRGAIALGVPAIRAYQMATINNARHWRLDRDHGGIAPGRYADILVVSDVERVAVTRVFASGREVARGGTLVQPLDPRPAPAYATDTVRLRRPLCVDDLAVPAPAGHEVVRAVVIPPFYWSREIEPIIQVLPVRHGRVAPAPERGINKVAVVDRHRASGNIGLGFWIWGLRRGAVAFTVLHDSHNLCIIGADDQDMLAAGRRVAEMRGGLAVVRDGRVLAELALPVWGLMSDQEPLKVAAAHENVEAAARALREGAPDPPHPAMPPHYAEALRRRPVDVMTFAFLTCDPWQYVLTDRGLFDMADESPLALIR